MREVLTQAFVTGWTAGAPDVPFCLENEALPTVDTFVLFSIVPTVSQQRTTGGPGTRRVERRGWVQVKLWGPVNAGSAGLATLGDVAQDILEMKSFPGPVLGDEPVTTYAAQAGPGGTSTDGRFYMALMRVPMVWWEQK